MVLWCFRNSILCSLTKVVLLEHAKKIEDTAGRLEEDLARLTAPVKKNESSVLWYTSVMACFVPKLAVLVLYEKLSMRGASYHTSSVTNNWLRRASTCANL